MRKQKWHPGASPSWGECVPPAAETKRFRSAMTLVELLVVIVILLIVTAAAIPLLATGAEGRKVREAARLVNTFITQARSRAIETGRPVGVQLERLPNNVHASMVLSMVEVPAPYAGGVANCMLGVDPRGRIMGFLPQEDGSWLGLLRQGDLVRLNYQGRLYRIFCGEPFLDPDGNRIYESGEPYFDTDGNGSYTASDPPLDEHGYFQLPAPGANPSVIWTLYPEELLVSPPAGPLLPNWQLPGNVVAPFQFFRQPVKTTGTPLQLPKGTVVDLHYSGMGASGVFEVEDAHMEPDRVDHEPIMFTFTPGGMVDRLYPGNGSSITPSSAIQLLIGKPEKSIEEYPTNPVAPNSSIYNLDDLTNLWVSIGHQTGMVSTSENVLSPSVNSLGEKISQARGIALGFQSMGGR